MNISCGRFTICTGPRAEELLPLSYHVDGENREHQKEDPKREIQDPSNAVILSDQPSLDEIDQDHDTSDDRKVGEQAIKPLVSTLYLLIYAHVV